MLMPASLTALRQGSLVRSKRSSVICSNLARRERLLEMLRPRSVGGDERKVDFGARHVGKLDFGVLGSLAEALEGHAILGEVDAGVVLELFDEPVHDAPVPVVAAEVGITIGGFDFEDAVAELEDRDIEGTAAEVIHGDGFFFLGVLVETERERSGGWLVDDALDFESGDLAGVLGCLALRVVEVRGNGDDSLGNFLAEIVFGGLLHLLKDESADFLRGIKLAVDIDANVVTLGGYLVRHELCLTGELVVTVSDEALDRIDSLVRVRDHLVLGRLTDNALALRGKSDDGRGGASTFRVLDDDGFSAFHDGHARVGGSKVNSDNLSHSI